MFPHLALMDHRWALLGASCLNVASVASVFEEPRGLLPHCCQFQGDLRVDVLSCHELVVHLGSTPWDIHAAIGDGAVRIQSALVSGLGRDPPG